MKLACLAFLSLLTVAVYSGGNADPFYLPLSMFRDGQHWALGYTLFGLLALIGALMAASLGRTGRTVDAVVFSLGVLLLAVIVVTPSVDGFHFLCSLVLLFLLFSYYGLLLFLAECWFLLTTHVLIPLVLAIATGCQSYGVWQKAFIVYFVLAITLHHHTLARWVPRSKAPSGRYPSAPLRKRIVYVVEDGKAWSRRG
jgi:hypothetical protein